MSGIYMKTLVAVLSVIAVSFFSTEAYADDGPVDCLAPVPQNIILTPTDTTITVTFDSGFECDNSGHLVEVLIYKVVLNADPSTNDAIPDQSGHVFTGLTPNTEYGIVVSAVSSYGLPTVGELLYVTTLDDTREECESDMTPKNVLLTPTDTTITVTFDSGFECNNEDELVEVELQRVLIVTDENNDATFDQSPHVFTGLTPNTEYVIYVVSVSSYGLPTEFEGPLTITTLVAGTPLEEEKAGNGCSGDCTPPTIGVDENNKRVVENGFSYNNNPVDVIAWHTPYPLITAIVNQTNTVEIIAYDNGGIFNLDMIQFGLGFEEFGQPLHDVEVLIEVHLEALYSENKVIVEKVVIRDRDNLIDTFTVFAVTETVDCADDGLDNDCLKVTLEYSYREATINNMMGVNVVDRSLNTQNFYLNDGVEVIGESMNPTPFVILPNKQTSQQTENLTKTLYRTDKVNDIWMDGSGIEYLKTGDNKFDRITPIAPLECNDPPLSEVNVPTRSNCHFRALTTIWG